MNSAVLEGVLRRLGIVHPLVLAPMAGVSTPELCAAVSSAGGLGSHGMGLPRSIQQVRDDIRAIRTLTNKPFAINMFIPPRDEHILSASEQHALATVHNAWWRATACVRDGDVDAAPAYSPDTQVTAAQLNAAFEEAVDVLVEERVPVFSFTFGLPKHSIVEKLKNAGTVLIGTATCVPEAIQLEAAGIDMVVVQGKEAGGHRGTWYTSGDYRNCLLPLSELLPAVVGAVRVPVLAAGGIGDGRGVAAALHQGAAAAVVGTAFMACDEAATPPFHKTALLSTAVRANGSTAVTQVASGKPARMLLLPSSKSAAPGSGREAELPVQPVVALGEYGKAFPNHWFLLPHGPTGTAVKTWYSQQRREGATHQRPDTGDIMDELDAQAAAMYPSLWSGTNYGACRAEGAAATFARLVEEFHKATSHHSPLSGA